MPTAHATQRGKRSRKRSVTAEMAKVRRNHADIQNMERPVPPRQPVWRWWSSSAGSDHFTTMTTNVMTRDHTSYGMTRGSQRRAVSKRGDRPGGTREKPERIKTSGTRQMESSAEPTTDQARP